MTKSQSRKTTSKAGRSAKSVVRVRIFDPYINKSRLVAIPTAESMDFPYQGEFHKSFRMVVSNWNHILRKSNQKGLLDWCREFDYGSDINPYYHQDISRRETYKILTHIMEQTGFIQWLMENLEDLSCDYSDDGFDWDGFFRIVEGLKYSLARAWNWYDDEREEFIGPDHNDYDLY